MIRASQLHGWREQCRGAAEGSRRGRRWAALVFSQAWRPAGVSERRAADSFLVPDKRPSEMSLTCFLSPLPVRPLPNDYSSRPRYRHRAPFDASLCFLMNPRKRKYSKHRSSHCEAPLYICTQTHAGPSWSNIIKSGGCVSLIDNCCAISSFLRRGRSHQR